MPTGGSGEGDGNGSSAALELVSQRAVEPSEADDRAGQAEEGVVEVGAAFPSGAQPAELVQPGQSALDRPTLPAQSGAVRDAAAAVDRWDCLHQGEELGDVVPVPAGHGHGERDAGPVGDQMVGGARMATV